MQFAGPRTDASCLDPRAQHFLPQPHQPHALLLPCCSLNLLHFHVGSQITNIRMVRAGAAQMQMCCWTCAPRCVAGQRVVPAVDGGASRCKQFLIVIFLPLCFVCRRSRR